MVAQYVPSKGKLELVNKIKALGSTPIIDFCFRKYYCYVVMENSDKLMILNFKPGRPKSPNKYMKYKDKPDAPVSSFGMLAIDSNIESTGDSEEPRFSMIEPSSSTKKNPEQPKFRLSSEAVNVSES